jgi:hypothetical protein
MFMEPEARLKEYSYMWCYVTTVYFIQQAKQKFSDLRIYAGMTCTATPDSDF